MEFYNLDKKALKAKQKEFNKTHFGKDLYSLNFFFVFVFIVWAIMFIGCAMCIRCGCIDYIESRIFDFDIVSSGILGLISFGLFATSSVVYKKELRKFMAAQSAAISKDKE